MNDKLIKTIKEVASISISKERKSILQPMVDYILNCRDSNSPIRLNFICTHNSRRSHLSQIWAQVMADFYRVGKVECYSGGTEATAVYSEVINTLSTQGFNVIQLSHDENPVYAIKTGSSNLPIIAFSKAYDHSYNPNNGYAAIMTCNHADQNCPIIIGADQRIPVTYVDPKAFDDSPLKSAKYQERSEQIASEMAYVFRTISSNS